MKPDLKVVVSNPPPALPLPALPGDSGPGAGDRYHEAFAEEIVPPLIGQ